MKTHSKISNFAAVVFLSALLVLILMTMVAHESRAQSQIPIGIDTGFDVIQIPKNQIIIRKKVDSLEDVNKYSWYIEENALRNQVGIGIPDLQFRREIETTNDNGDTVIISKDASQPNRLTNPLGIDTNAAVEHLMRRR